MLRGCVWYIFSYVRKKALCNSVAITERRDMCLMIPLSMSLLGFGMGTMLANFHMYTMLVRNVSQRGPMCFRCLMFSLSGPCEIFTWFYCLLDLSCCECDVISLYCMCFPVNGYFSLVCL